MAKTDIGTVYLIHFDEPYKGTRHYIGWTSLPLEERMYRHRSNGNRGACLLRACNLAGITWNVVRSWENKTFEFEQLLKKQKNHKRFCPVCNPDGYLKYHNEEEKI